MSLFDNLNDNIGDLKDNIKLAGEKISQNSKEIARVAKIKLEIAKEEKNLNEMYKAIGKYYYDLHKGIENSESDPMSGYIAGIDKSVARIESLKLNLMSSSNDFTVPGGNIKVYHEDDKDNGNNGIVFINEKDLK